MPIRDIIAERRGGLVAAVIPTFRARATIRRVVERALSVVDFVVVVDDQCPDSSGNLVEGTPHVHVLRHARNRGVGGATKTGIAAALALGAQYVVKLDADDQMDVSFVPLILDIFEEQPDVHLIKGNRFGDARTLKTMPATRLIGNAALTLLVKFSTGYWTLVDPTNGFIAIRASALRHIAMESLAERYFFEIDLLSAFGLLKLVIAEVDMPAIYAGETSSLSIPRVLFEFPPKLLLRLLRRLLINYLIVEINVASICGFLGIPLFVVAVIFGAHEWAASVASGIPRPTGTIVLALLLFMIGFQLSLQALFYDVQFAPRTIKIRRDPQLAVERNTDRGADPSQVSAAP